MTVWGRLRAPPADAFGTPTATEACAPLAIPAFAEPVSIGLGGAGIAAGVTGERAPLAGVTGNGDGGVEMGEGIPEDPTSNEGAAVAMVDSTSSSAATSSSPRSSAVIACS